MLPNEATTVPHFPPLALIAKENKSGKSSGYCCTCHHTIHPNRELFAASARRTLQAPLLNDRDDALEQKSEHSSRRVLDDGSLTSTGAAANGGAGRGGASTAGRRSNGRENRADRPRTPGFARRGWVQKLDTNQLRWRWSATRRQAGRAEHREEPADAAPRRRDGTGGVYVAPLSGRRWRSGPSAARGLEQEYARARGPACFVLVSAGKQAGTAARPARQASGLHRSTHVPVPPPAVGAPPASGCPPYSIRAGP